MSLKTPVSLRARRIIQDAFEDLEQTVAPQDARQFGGTTLDNVLNAAREIENHLAARRSLRNMRRLVPLFKGMEHYAKTIEVLCIGTPYLSWIWAPIPLILKVCSAASLPSLSDLDPGDLVLTESHRVQQTISMPSRRLSERTLKLANVYRGSRS